MDTQTQTLRERALAAYQTRVAAQEAERREQAERYEREQAERYDRWAEQAARGVREALGAEATPVPDRGLAVADCLAFRADEERGPHGGPPRWRLLVYQPCQRCGEPTDFSANVYDLADLGGCLETWQTYPITCASCIDQDESPTEPEPLDEPSRAEVPDEVPASGSDALTKLVDLLGALLRDRGWIAHRACDAREAVP